jgi:hypothetical protein
VSEFMKELMDLAEFDPEKAINKNSSSSEG